jgi:hypothetical protein
MYKLVKIIFFSLLTCWLLSSCGEYPCGKASSTIALIGFTGIDSDAVILRRFSKGTNFTTLTDSIILNRSNSNFQVQHDTLLILYGSTDGNDAITADYDYQIVLPKINRVFGLSDIVENVQYGRNNGTKEYCLNNFTSYKIDGQPVSSINTFNFIYFKL